jgi:hypothetical protein
VIPPELILRVVGLALLGAYLIVAGFWPRRRGDTLRCRRCEYDISDQPRERCPECGTSLNAQTMVRGTRTRVAWKIWVGVALVVLSGVSVVPNVVELFREGQLDRYRPFAHLLRQAVGSDDVGATRAFNELGRRLVQHEFSAAEVSTVVEFCLAQESLALPPRCSGQARTLFQLLGDVGAMNPAQVGQAFDVAWDVRLEVAPVTELGGVATVSLIAEPRRRLLASWLTPIVARIRCTQVTLDGAQTPTAKLSTFELRVNQNAYGGCDLILDGPGEHEIGVSWVAEVSAVPLKENDFSHGLPSTPAITREYSAVVRTQTVDRDAYDREVAAHFDDCFEFKELHEWLEGKWVPTLEVVRPMPLPVKLVVSIELPGQRGVLGYWSLREGFAGPLSIASLVRWPLPGKVDGLIKLKSTVPLSDGQNIERLYTFKGIRVKRLPPAKASQ